MFKLASWDVAQPLRQKGPCIHQLGFVDTHGHDLSLVLVDVGCWRVEACVIGKLGQVEACCEIVLCELEIRLAATKSATRTQTRIKRNFQIVTNTLIIRYPTLGSDPSSSDNTTPTRLSKLRDRLFRLRGSTWAMLIIGVHVLFDVSWRSES